MIEKRNLNERIMQLFAGPSDFGEVIRVDRRRQVAALLGSCNLFGNPDAVQ